MRKREKEDLIEDVAARVQEFLASGPLSYPELDGQIYYGEPPADLQATFKSEDQADGSSASTARETRRSGSEASAERGEALG